MKRWTEKGADETIYLPTSELLDLQESEARPNPVARKKKRSRAKAKEPRYFEPEALEIYAGFEGFLVRTAVIRSVDYDKRNAPLVNGPHRAADICQHLRFADQEHLVVLALDSGLHLLAIHETAIGGTSSASQELKHLIKVPLLVSSSAVIMVHNHPSGSPVMSADDKVITRKVQEGLECLGIQLLDAVVVAREGFSSAVDEGVLKR